MHQLYDLKTDIGEENNVSKEYPEIVDELKNLLKSYILSGRSTQGEDQEYATSVNWPGLDWMNQY